MLEGSTTEIEGLAKSKSSHDLIDLDSGSATPATSDPSGSSEVSPRKDEAGSSRTTFHIISKQPESSSGHSDTVSTATTTASTSQASLISLLQSQPSTSTEANDVLQTESSTQRESISQDMDTDTIHAPYRSPEPVIDVPDDDPPGFVPGVIAEHPLHDVEMPSRDESWTEDVAGLSGDPWGDGIEDTDMQYGEEKVDRPSIGPGCIPRRWLKIAHEHDLLRPKIKDIPPPKSRPVPPTPSASTAASIVAADVSTPAEGEASSSAAPSQASSSTHEPTRGPVYTLDDVLKSCPGGIDNHDEWYFCVTCWGWVRIYVDQSTEPLVDDIDAWGPSTLGSTSPGSSEADLINTRRREYAKYMDLVHAKQVSTHYNHHLHEVNSLFSSQAEPPIELLDPEETLKAFPHLTAGMETDEAWTTSSLPQSNVRLFTSCSSSLWMIVEGVIPGQIPIGLVNAFNREKVENPNPGTTPMNSVLQAWELISTLLYNPLFNGNRGWVKLDNQKFLSKIGTTILSSHLLRQIGFGCRQEENALRVGPMNGKTEDDESEIPQMDRYMLRTWVEIGLYLAAYRKRNQIDPPENSLISASSFQDLLKTDIGLDTYPRSFTPFGDSHIQACNILGITTFDTPKTAGKAYKMQVSDDPQGGPSYLWALEDLSTVPLQGQQDLQMMIASERSLDRYTTTDLQDAYDRIGYTKLHEADIAVEVHEAPDDYILELHKKAVQENLSSERNNLFRALELIGRHRQSESIMEIAKSGETILSVDDAFDALSAPKESVDDGLILQYNLAISDFPGKTDYYRKCLELIANAPGAERPGLQNFLRTGKTEPDVPPRNDIPVGLQNIGNTCYLNSILQYIYSIKPLRDEVLSFEQQLLGSYTPSTREIGRSRRFVRQLRLLFLQLYMSEGSSVRPDEELAYLAITRPEVDEIVEPEITVTEQPRKSILDSIPDIPSESPSSTRVASPAESPVHQPGSPAGAAASSPVLEAPPRVQRSESILGKRASTDRDDSSRSSAEHTRQKSNESDAETPVDTPLEMEEDGYFPLIPKDAPEAAKVMEVIQPNKARSPSATRDIEALNLRSSPDETVEVKEVKEEVEMEEKVEMPTVPPPLPPRPLVSRKDTLASGLKFGLQQDSAEVLINVLSQLELGLSSRNGENAERTNLIQQLFSCKYHQQLFYESAQGVVEAQTPIESVFVHPIIGVEEEGKDLYDCLGELYLGGSDIEYEGKKGYMMDLMDSFPPMLYIQMRRSQFDMTTGRERKLNTHIAFDQTITLDRFLVNADKAKRDESVDITREMIQTRARLHQLRNHKPMSIPDTFKHVRDSLGQMSNEPDLDITSDFLEALDREGQEVIDEIDQLQAKLPTLKERLDGIWRDQREYEYELVAVFMHRGRTSGAGHYWTYQAHLPDNSEEFFKYNDETVTVVDRAEVLQDRTGSDANPALLCYVRKGRNLIDTLHREILDRGALVQDTIVEDQQEGEGEKEEPEIVEETQLVDVTT